MYDEKETEALIQELFYDRDIEKTEGEEDGSEGSAISKSDISIEVLNGTGIGNKLQKVVDQLQGAGYKVTRTGSTNTTARTTIINKKNVKETLLKNMQNVIGAGTISTSDSSSSKVDVQIIICFS